MAKYSDVRQVIESLSGANAETEKIANSMNESLSRTAAVDNALEVDIDANNYTFYNLRDPDSDSQPVTKGYADANYSTSGAEFATLAEQAYQDTLVVKADTEILYNDFFDVWQGASATDPVGTFQAGDLYFNTNDNLIKAYNGVSWISPYATAADTFTDVTVDSLQFTGGIGTQGTMSWNTTDETLDLIQNGAVLQLGQEVQRHVRNNTGSTILNGTPVMVSGTIGASGRVTVAPMDGTVRENFRKFIGLATEDIANGDDGKITDIGKVRGINTTAYSEGDELWVSTTVVGGLTNVEPTSGMKVLVGYVVSSATNGTIALNKERGGKLSDLHDVNSTTLEAKDMLRYTGTEWEEVKQFREEVFNLTGTDIDPANGTIQYKTLAANTTFTESLVEGDSVTLMIDDGTGFTVTWPTISWVGGSAPTLATTGYSIIVIWKVQTTLYGLFVGAA